MTITPLAKKTLIVVAALYVLAVPVFIVMANRAKTDATEEKMQLMAEDIVKVLHRHGKADASMKDGVAIAEVTRGGHVGEMALLDDAPRSATVCATEQTHAFVIRRDQFVKLLRSDSGLANKILWCFLHMLSGRLRTTSDELTVAQSRARRLTEVPNIFD